MSFGYDSRTVFTKAVTDIDDVAAMLLDRINGERQSAEEKERPLILIAHSLGGIVVKKVWARTLVLRLILIKFPNLGYDSSSREVNPLQSPSDINQGSCVFWSTPSRRGSRLLG
jgi:alpha-beta hydrolase superfamily lysophospholipase